MSTTMNASVEGAANAPKPGKVNVHDEGVDYSITTPNSKDADLLAEMLSTTPAKLEPDEKQLERFIIALFRHADPGTWASLRTFRDDDAIAPPFEIRAVRLKENRAQLIYEAGKVAKRAAQAKNRMVFCPPVATFNNPDTAREIDLAQGLALSVECDSTPAAAREILENLLGPATIVMESGGRWTDPDTGVAESKLHMHWRLAVPTRDPESHAKLKRARGLARFLVGGDATAIPMVHPLRWAGSWHRKAEPRLSVIIGGDPNREIDLDAALTALTNAADDAGIPTTSIIGTSSNSLAKPVNLDDRDAPGHIATLALHRLDAWVPVAFPAAVQRNADNWRVSSDDLGRDLQEALSFTSKGITDFGIDLDPDPITMDPRHQGHTAITVLQEFCKLDDGDPVLRDVLADEPGMTADEAVRWLADRLDIDYEALLAEKAAQRHEAAKNDFDAVCNGDPVNDNDQPYVWPHGEAHPWTIEARNWSRGTVVKNYDKLSELRRASWDAIYDLAICWDWPSSSVHLELDAYDSGAPSDGFWTEERIAAAAEWSKSDLQTNLGPVARLRRDNMRIFEELQEIWAVRLDAKDKLIERLDAIDAEHAPTEQKLQRVGYHAPRPATPPVGLGKTVFPPPRPWVLGRRFLAYTTAFGIAQPGTGKSAMALLSAVAIVTGRKLTGEDVIRSGPVWYHDNEDSLDEIWRRLTAICIAHDIDADSLRDRLFVSGKDETPLVLAVKDARFETIKETPAVKEIISRVKGYGVVHLAIGPLVSLHKGISENANDEMDAVASIINRIASATGVSVDVTHHSVKSHSGNSESRAGDMNAARGAGATMGAGRGGYSLSLMSKKTAEELDIPESLAGRLVRLDAIKANYAPGGKQEKWFEFQSISWEDPKIFAAEDADPMGGKGADAIFADDDSTGVLVPWSIKKAQANASKAAEAKAAMKTKSLVDVIAAKMSKDRCPIGDVLPAVMDRDSVKDRKARDLIMNAVPRESGTVADVDGKRCTLKLERSGEAVNAPIFLVREWEAESAQ